MKNITMKTGYLSLLAVAVFACTAPAADSRPYLITVKPAENQPAPALHSFALAVHDGKWLIVGGRTNGFHRTSQPESTFPSRFSNDQLYVVDPAGNRLWKAALPAKHRLQLRATNMGYYQDQDVLYLVGGYGSRTEKDGKGDYHTFPTLTAIRVPQIIAAIISGNQEKIADSVSSTTDNRMQVTGGGLQKLGDRFYLVFGQNYDQKYKGAITGQYTFEVRHFRIRFDGHDLAIEDPQSITDPAGPGPDSQYRRRDLNVVPAVRSDGTLGITAYGGVFTKGGGPWRRPVYIDRGANGQIQVNVDKAFEQRMCQYDCARLMMFDPLSRTMYTTFFGGITYYYYNAQGELEESNLRNFMPFTGAITTVTRQANGKTVEIPQGPADGLPGLLGAEAVFIPLDGIPRFQNRADILDFSKLLARGKIKIGYLYGGIRALEPQVTEKDPSFASGKIFEVFLEAVQHQGRDDAVEGIKDGNNRLSAAFARHDAPAAADVYSGDARLFPPGKDSIIGRKAIEEFWKGTFDGGYVALKLETTEVRSSGDLAFEVGKFTLTNKDSTLSQSGEYCVVWTRVNNKWKLHRDIWNTLRKGE